MDCFVGTLVLRAESGAVRCNVAMDRLTAGERISTAKSEVDESDRNLNSDWHFLISP